MSFFQVIYMQLSSSFLLEAAVPPWVDSNEEETIQQQILALSAVSISFPLRFEMFSWRN